MAMLKQTLPDVQAADVQPAYRKLAEGTDSVLVSTLVEIPKKLQELELPDEALKWFIERMDKLLNMLSNHEEQLVELGGLVACRRQNINGILNLLRVANTTNLKHEEHLPGLVSAFPAALLIKFSNHCVNGKVRMVLQICICLLVYSNKFNVAFVICF